MNREKIVFPFSYLITDGAVSREGYERDALKLAQNAGRLARAGLSAVQIREKSLPADLVRDLAKRVVSAVRGTGAICLVNERFDVAVAAGAHGVHLTSRSVPVDVVRSSVPDGFVIGVSTHSADEIAKAAAGGADFAVFGPVFETPGKGAPAGACGLKQAVDAAGGMPVIALGGLSADNLREALSAGARGVAGIRMFLEPESADAVLEGLSAFATEMNHS